MEHLIPMDPDGTSQTYDFHALLLELGRGMTVGEMFFDSTISFPPEAQEYVREVMEDIIDLRDALAAKEEAKSEGTISQADLKRELGF